MVHDAKHEIQKRIDQETSIFWHRRDLRMADNAGLYHALKQEQRVVPIFIFDTDILSHLERNDARVDFIHQSITSLKAEYENLGSTLLVLVGKPVDVFRDLTPKAVYCNHDYEPYGMGRDGEIKIILENKSCPFYSFKDQVVFEKGEVAKDDGTPYTVFTPYSKKWKSLLNNFYLESYPVEKFVGNLLQTEPAFLPGLRDLGFEASGLRFGERKIKTSIISTYHLTRDYPGQDGTSRLSVHLRFGTVSIRQLATLARRKNEAWLNELIWRDFYHMILWHFPRVVGHAFKSPYDHVAWRNDEAEFQQWCDGKTGYPLVDAGMRELNTTGFMHNRVRMVVASFLTKHLLIDWRWGEAYFAKKLLDFDLAANNGGWQWAAGSGCDAAPYFRVFNPALQTAKFDPELKYIKTWVPELNTPEYPLPIVNHAAARVRVLAAYKQALHGVSA